MPVKNEGSFYDVHMPKVSDAYLEQRRQHILDAAVTCFARTGFHRTSMHDIIAEAGLSPGGVYRYFASKDELISAISVESIDRVGAVVDASLDRQSELADALGDALEALSSTGPGSARVRLAVQVWAETLRDERLAETMQAAVGRLTAALARRVVDGQRTGDFPQGIDPDATARVLLGIVQGFILQRAWDPGLRPDAYAASLAALVGRGVAPRR